MNSNNFITNVRFYWRLLNSNREFNNNCSIQNIKGNFDANSIIPQLLGRLIGPCIILFFSMIPHGTNFRVRDIRTEHSTKVIGKKLWTSNEVTSQCFGTVIIIFLESCRCINRQILNLIQYDVILNYRKNSLRLF